MVHVAQITLSLGLPERLLPLNVKSCVMNPGPVVLAWWALAVMPGTCARHVMWESRMDVVRNPRKTMAKLSAKQRGGVYFTYELHGANQSSTFQPFCNLFVEGSV